MQLSLDRLDGVVFDMDGLLLDTEKVALACFEETWRAFNYKPDLELYTRCIGTTSSRTREILTEGYGPDFPYETIRERWNQRYEEILTKCPIPVKPGAVGLLGFLHQSRCRIALATSTEHGSAVSKLRKTGLHRFFSVIVGGDQVENGKPDPDIYLRACNLLDVAPARSLALEDSDNGVLSAYRAGLAVIQIPDLKAPAREIRDLGHVIVACLDDVRVMLANESY